MGDSTTDPERVGERSTFTVGGNHGELSVDSKTGLVLSCTDSADIEGDGYRFIRRFDVDEWRQFYPGEEPVDMMIDILDIGYWEAAGGKRVEYEPPEDDYRNELRLMKGTPEKELACEPTGIPSDGSP